MAEKEHVKLPKLIARIAVVLCSGVLFSGSAATKSRPARSAPVATIPLQPYLNGQPGTFMFDSGQGVSSFSPAFAAKVGCRPWGRTTGFRMSGERLDNQHCDNITFDLS